MGLAAGAAGWALEADAELAEPGPEGMARPQSPGSEVRHGRVSSRLVTGRRERKGSRKERKGKESHGTSYKGKERNGKVSCVSVSLFLCVCVSVSLCLFLCCSLSCWGLLLR